MTSTQISLASGIPESATERLQEVIYLKLL